jgi:hypothetical protein
MKKKVFLLVACATLAYAPAHAGGTPPKQATLPVVATATNPPHTLVLGRVVGSTEIRLFVPIHTHRWTNNPTPTPTTNQWSSAGSKTPATNGVAKQNSGAIAPGKVDGK